MSDGNKAVLTGTYTGPDGRGDIMLQYTDPRRGPRQIPISATAPCLKLGDDEPKVEKKVETVVEEKPKPKSTVANLERPCLEWGRKALYEWAKANKIDGVHQRNSAETLLEKIEAHRVGLK